MKNVSAFVIVMAITNQTALQEFCDWIGFANVLIVISSNVLFFAPKRVSNLLAAIVSICRRPTCQLWKILSIDHFLMIVLKINFSVNALNKNSWILMMIKWIFSSTLDCLSVTNASFFKQNNFSYQFLLYFILSCLKLRKIKIFSHN